MFHERTETMLQIMDVKNWQMEKNCIMSSPAETVAQFASVAGSDILLPTALFSLHVLSRFTGLDSQQILNHCTPASSFISRKAKRGLPQYCWSSLCVGCMCNKWLYYNTMNCWWIRIQRCGNFYLAQTNKKSQHFASLFQHWTPPYLAIGPFLNLLEFREQQPQL